MTVSRKIWGGFAGLLLLGSGAAAVWWPRRVIPEVVAPVQEPGLGWPEQAEAPAPGAPALPEPAVAGPAVSHPATPDPAVPGPIGPSFDVVRVSPDGSAVVAGRAAPGAEVVVKDGDAEVARVRAGSDGAFVALPPTPFAPGGRELTLAARTGDGPEVKGDGSVLLVVPPPSFAGGEGRSGEGHSGEKPLVEAVLVPGGAAPRVLQGPGAGRTTTSALSLDTVDYDDKGVIRFMGGAAVGGALRLYVDNGEVGDVQADEHGRWSLKPEAAMPPGVHALRVDELDSSGQVVARVELPFERATVSEATLVRAGGRVVVQPGQNLWRLARAVYGQGTRYRVIYLANRDQIRDPRRIYPGQAFAVPKVKRRRPTG